MISILWALFAVLAAYVLYTRYLDFCRDVPPEYLKHQSVAENTRKPDELAIHKSTKLDYSTGLRVGLGIRYDHYKIRNGNLNDIWEILIGHHGRSSVAKITIDGEQIKISQLIAAVDTLSELFRSWNDVLEVAMLTELYMAKKPTLALTIASFLAQIPVHVYDESSKHLVACDSAIIADDKGDLSIVKASDRSCLLRLDTLDFAAEKHDFANEYHLEKDRGIALRVSTRLNHKVLASTQFTQLNLVSAVASCIKHLPPNVELGNKDLLVIVQDHSTPESILNETIKVLVLFVTGSELILAHNSSNFMAYKPTVLVTGPQQAKAIPVVPRLLGTFLYYHRLFSLSRHRFPGASPMKNSQLRLIYVHRDCSSGCYTNWNTLRASLGVNVVEEIGHYNIAGPFLVTDYYEFRTFPAYVTAKIAASGAVVQANEMKLLGSDPAKPRDLAIRGYNIGKTLTIMRGVGQIHEKPDDEGFHRLPYVCRWGTDGCLYILKNNL